MTKRARNAIMDGANLVNSNTFIDEGAFCEFIQSSTYIDVINLYDVARGYYNHGDFTLRWIVNLLDFVIDEIESTEWNGSDICNKCRILGQGVINRVHAIEYDIANGHAGTICDSSTLMYVGETLQNAKEHSEHYSSPSMEPLDWVRELLIHSNNLSHIESLY